MSEVVIAIISRKNRHNEDEYLLVSSKKDLGDNTGLYYPPGGHVESGENKETALKRELLEELKLSIDPIREIATTPGDVVGQLTYWWSCKPAQGEIEINSDELFDANYFTKEQMKSLKIWPATKKFFDAYIFNYSLSQ